MPRNHGTTARAAPGRAGAALLLFALVGLLGGCDAIYDDTKGWANRLEASILEAAHELEEDPEAETPEHYTPEVVEPPRSPSPGSASAMTPVPAQLPRFPAPADQPPPAGPRDGTVADAAGSLMVPAAADEAADQATEQSVAAKAPEADGEKAKQPAKSDGDAAKDAAKKAPPPLPIRKPQMAKADKAATPDDTMSAKGSSASTGENAGSKEPGAERLDPLAMVLHLSSLRSEAAAKREWRTLKRDFPVALGKMEAEIRRTELGDKGTFYRVLAGPLPSRTLAQEACDAVKARNVRQYCRVVPSTPEANSPS